jgi:hypothetical protein
MKQTARLAEKSTAKRVKMKLWVISDTASLFSTLNYRLPNMGNHDEDAQLFMKYLERVAI